MKVKPIVWQPLPNGDVSVDKYQHIDVNGIKITNALPTYLIEKTSGGYYLHYRDEYIIGMATSQDDIIDMAQRHRLEYLQSLIELETYTEKWS